MTPLRPVLLAAALMACAAPDVASRETTTRTDSSAGASTTGGALTTGADRPRALPAVGVAVRDSAGRWCTAWPSAAGSLAAGQPVTLVHADLAPTTAAGVRARLGERRDAPCATAFGQPRWADYTMHDVVLEAAPGTAADDGPDVALAVASAVTWTRDDRGRARADLDGDGRPEEARRCTADEGEHLTLWTLDPDGTRSWRAHEYFDWGALVEPTCAPEERGA